jgi:hypothetical protein
MPWAYDPQHGYDDQQPSKDPGLSAAIHRTMRVRKRWVANSSCRQVPRRAKYTTALRVPQILDSAKQRRLWLGRIVIYVGHYSTSFSISHFGELPTLPATGTDKLT